MAITLALCATASSKSAFAQPSIVISPLARPLSTLADEMKGLEGLAQEFAANFDVTFGQGPQHLTQFDMFSLSSGAPFEGRHTKGKPFAADVTQESTQLLADGTRLVNKTVTRMARDAEGRFRQDSTTASGKKRAWIFDPVAKRSVVLDLDAKTATVSDARSFSFGDMSHFMPNVGEIASKAAQAARSARAAGTDAQGIAEAARKALREAGLPVDGLSSTVVSPDGKTTISRNIEIITKNGNESVRETESRNGQTATATVNSRNAQTESLGLKVLEGVNAEGTRRTVTFPVGQIGNDRPIVSTMEVWKSPDLEMTIFSRSVDPRKGETVYKMQNIVRDNPPLSQFSIPEGFKIRESRAFSFSRTMKS